MIEVKYVDHMGDDLSVVNAAKVSFGARSEWEYSCEFEGCIEGCKPLSEGCIASESDGCGALARLSKKDQSLISFLARGCTSDEWGLHLYDLGGSGPEQMERLVNHIKRMPAHWSPFAHTAISLNIKMPIFVARQIMKHTTGIEYNEVSRRYVKDSPSLFTPDKWREASEDVKQGSSDKEVLSGDYFYYEYKDDNSVPLKWQCGVDTTLEQVIENHNESCLELYQDMVDRGVAPEQARMVLPQSMMTEVVATGNLYAFANMYNQRIDPHAQYESQLVAKGVGKVLEGLYPYSFKELTK